MEKFEVNEIVYHANIPVAPSEIIAVFTPSTPSRNGGQNVRAPFAGWAIISL